MTRAILTCPECRREFVRHRAGNMLPEHSLPKSETRCPGSRTKGIARSRINRARQREASTGGVPVHFTRGLQEVVLGEVLPKGFGRKKLGSKGAKA